MWYIFFAMRGRKPKFTREQIEQALQAHHGQVVLAARALGCSYRTVLRYIERYPDLDALRHELRLEVVERVENVLVERALDGEAWAVQFLLKNWARETYGDRVQVQQQGEVNLHFELSDTDRKQLYAILQRVSGVGDF